MFPLFTRHGNFDTPINIVLYPAIAERLTQPDSVLRTSDDASLLLQSLLDLGFRHWPFFIDSKVPLSIFLISCGPHLGGNGRISAQDPQPRALHFAYAAVRRSSPFHSLKLLTFLPITVHILSCDMILHKPTLDPIKTMIYGLRRYDLDRSAAIASEMASILDEEKCGVDSDCDRESEWHDVTWRRFEELERQAA